MIGLFRKLKVYAGLLPQSRRNDLARAMWRRPLLLAAIGGYEAAVLGSSRLEDRPKLLAGIKASSRIGCPY